MLKVFGIGILLVAFIASFAFALYYAVCNIIDCMPNADDEKD